MSLFIWWSVKIVLRHRESVFDLFHCKYTYRFSMFTACLPHLPMNDDESIQNSPSNDQRNKKKQNKRGERINLQPYNTLHYLILEWVIRKVRLAVTAKPVSCQLATFWYYFFPSRLVVSNSCCKGLIATDLVDPAKEAATAHKTPWNGYMCLWLCMRRSPTFSDI